VIAAGYGSVLLDPLILLTTFGYDQSPGAEPSVVIPNPISGQYAVVALVLATVSRVSLTRFRPAVRLESVTTIGGVLFLLLGILLIWDGWFTLDAPTIQLLNPSPLWKPALKLGFLVVGAVPIVLGSVVRRERRSSTQQRNSIARVQPDADH
jgi:hypothetical protein